MRPTSARHSPPAPPVDLRRLVERLDGLPIRPGSARATLDAPASPHPVDGEPAPAPPATELDPGWVLTRLRAPAGPDHDPLATVADRPWWRAGTEAGLSALNRLWRHAVATSLAARRLAREANLADPTRIGRAGLLGHLGLWALGAVDADRLAAWFAADDAEARREVERSALGAEAQAVGRTLATRWGCDPLVVDVAWLVGDPGDDLIGCADDPTELAILRRAWATAERTPWAVSRPPGRDPGPLDPRVRISIAEVQARCSGDFIDDDATPREERLSRDLAATRREAAGLRRDRETSERLLAALAQSDPTDRPETWAERVGLAWCDAPGVAAARVAWIDPASATEPAAVGLPRPATSTHRLGPPDRPLAEIQLWTGATVDQVSPSLDAWGAWAGWVAETARLRRKLDATAVAFRRRSEAEEALRRRAKLDALGEFAAGAGHELNNPLAVILGRAQLLMSRIDDPEAARGLRAIVTQAQRAHRILRDLMYVARPPEPRPRHCSPDDVLKAAIRDAQDEAEARGIRLIGDPRSAAVRKVWVDPDPLRHVADVLIRNAIEATAPGGSVFVASGGDERAIRWTVKDSGRGLTGDEAAHILDPFYCGRQAGRGLGLGLPRVVRIVERVGGDLTWQSILGQGTTFHVRYPAPAEPDDAAPARAKSA